MEGYTLPTDVEYPIEQKESSTELSIHAHIVEEESKNNIDKLTDDCLINILECLSARDRIVAERGTF